MLQFDFTSNPNGKLFNDIFGDIRLRSNSFQAGTECEISYHGQFMGYAKIEVVRSFPFSKLNDAASYLNCGKPTPYQASLLTRYYNGGKMISAETIFQIIIFRWIERKMEAQNILIQEWWDSKQTNKVDL